MFTYAHFLLLLELILDIEIPPTQLRNIKITNAYS